MITGDNVMRKILLAVVVTLSFISYAKPLEPSVHPVVSDIKKMAQSEKLHDHELSLDSIRKKIETNPEQAALAVVQELKEKKSSQKEISLYLWVLGTSKSKAHVDEIMKIASENEDEDIFRAACWSLTEIGGNKVEDFLIGILKQTNDPVRQYDVLDNLARMKSIQALPFTIEVLRKDPAEYYWQSIFVFGKYGDTGIPFLLQHIADEDQNVRMATIVILGQWLNAKEAVLPLQEQYWKEKDSMVRANILASLESANPDMDDIVSFSKKVTEKEKDPDVLQFARETVASADDMNDGAKDYLKQKKQNAEEFKATYSEIKNSLGTKGDYDKLKTTSTISDESSLKKLRETILNRNSDECFYDYRKINRVILMNRRSHFIETKSTPLKEKKNPRRVNQ